MAKSTSKKPSKNANKSNSAPGMSKIVEEDESKKTNNPDNEINSGFANYMRSSEGEIFYFHDENSLKMLIKKNQSFQYFYLSRDCIHSHTQQWK